MDRAAPGEQRDRHASRCLRRGLPAKRLRQHRRGQRPAHRLERRPSRVGMQLHHGQPAFLRGEEPEQRAEG